MTTPPRSSSPETAPHGSPIPPPARPPARASSGRRADAIRPGQRPTDDQGRAGGPPGTSAPGVGAAVGALVRRARLTIGVKVTVLVGGLVAVLLVASLLLIGQGRASSSTYNRLLAGPVAQSLQARRMQVEFKKQVQDWKDVLLRGFNPADMANYLNQFRQEDQLVSQINADMIAKAADPGLRAQLERFRDAHRDLDLDYSKALAAFQAGGGKDPTVPDKMVRGLDRPPTDLIDAIVSGLETQVADGAARQESENAGRSRATLIAGSGVLLVLIGVLALAVLNIVRPIRRLTREAFAVATERLPAAIRTIKTLDAGVEPPTLPPFTVTTRDELRELGDAFNGLQSSALELAVEQHRADRETADMLVNLGRRNQNLLGRMLGYVTELERQEQDPDVLSQLFRLDHATTRIRRNAESMLVLAGATQTRTWSRPVPVIDVVRASLSEIEEYIRVDLHHVEDGLVNGTAVADVVHLVAELVENATHFSPPTTQVTVIGQSVREGYRLRVIDQGVGMTRRELDEANQRIRRTGSGWSDVKLLGLYVVGRLARRRGIQVTLEASAGRGITASILLPTSLLAGHPAAGQPSAALPPDVEVPAPTATDRLIDLTPHGLTVNGVSADGVSADGVTANGSDAASLVPAGVPAWPGEQGGEPSTRFGPVPRPDVPMPAPRTSPYAVAGTDAPIRTAPGADPANPANPYAVPPPVAVPRRVRGAQLPDLGPGDEPVVARPDEGPGAPESLRWQLRSFQLDVQAARRAIAGDEPQPGQDHADHAHRAEHPDHLDHYHRRPEGER